MDQTIEVAAAIIENEQGQILIARRKPGKSQGGLWDFPGGKLEPGESPEACLIRELQEEMGIGHRAVCAALPFVYGMGYNRLSLN